MNLLMILNDAPYGTERTYNGLRLAMNLLSRIEGAQVAVFLMGDAVSSAKAGQRTPAASRRPRSWKGVAGARSTSSPRRPRRPRRSWSSEAAQEAWQWL